MKPPNSIPNNGSVLGIDVGFSIKTKSSAICRLDWNDNRLSWVIKRFRAVYEEQVAIITEVATDAAIIASALDGPMRCGLDTIRRYRCAERMLTRKLQTKIGKPGQSNAPVGISLNVATNICAQIVKEKCNLRPSSHQVKIDPLAIVEAFPSAFLGLLIVEPTSIKTQRGNRSDLYFEHLIGTGVLQNLLEFLLPQRKPTENFTTITNHDDRAAFICAITALCVANNKYTAVGDEDGWIILPPREFILEWGLADLKANDRENQLDSLYFS